MDSPASDLSDYDSDDFPDAVKTHRPASLEPMADDNEPGRPNKRPRLNPPAASPEAAALPMAAPDEFGDISEDTDGSVPASPHHPGLSADDDFGHDQVTVCKWEDCTVGDLGNMDNLVDHLHDDHIGSRQKKYSCEWTDCTRKGIPHASGYALRAHMRSHTREKPFYCTLPECDRSFTRSDALAKHMRTVHETEALRPSDPVPKHHSSNPSNRFQRLRLVLNNGGKEKGSTPASPSSHVGPSSANGGSLATDAEYAQNNVTYVQDLKSHGAAPTVVQFPPDLDFTPHELSLPAPELFRLLCRQLQWATREGEQLRAEAEALEAQRKEEWKEKELVLENLMEAEFASLKRKRQETGLPLDPEAQSLIEEDIVPSKKLSIAPTGGQLPWWRQDKWIDGASRETKFDGPDGAAPESVAQLRGGALGEQPA